MLHVVAKQRILPRSSEGRIDRFEILAGAGLEDAMAAAAITGAPLHEVHINSSPRNRAPQILQVICEARSRGLDVTTEMYPYIARCIRIEWSSLGRLDEPSGFGLPQPAMAGDRRAV